MPKRKQPKTWQGRRKLAWLRFAAQCRYREEIVIDYPTWCELWNTEELFNRKGISNEQLYVSKIDFEKPYSRLNVCLTTGRLQRRYRQHYQHGLASGIPEQDIIRRLD